MKRVYTPGVRRNQANVVRVYDTETIIQMHGNGYHAKRTRYTLNPRYVSGHEY